MHQNMALGYENWSTPPAAANLMEWFVTEGITVNSHNMYLFNSMIECETGMNRLPKPLIGESVRIGHKTGTGPINDNGEIMAVNDAGFVLLQDGRHYSIAIFVKDYKGNMAEAEHIIADISEIVYKYMTGN
jgi:beta-lactamase class A